MTKMGRLGPGPKPILAGMRYAFLLLLIAAAAAEPPRGWRFDTTSPQGYASAVDRTNFHSGGSSGFLHSVGAVTKRTNAVLMQSVTALPYKGRRLKLSGYVQTRAVAGWAGLFLRVDPREGPALEFENMQDRPIQGNTPWTRYSLELDVPAEGDQVHFGVLLAGQGEVWLDDVQLETLEASPPGTRERSRVRGPGNPTNLGFEDPPLRGDGRE